MGQFDQRVTRFPNGFTNIGPNKPLSQMPQPDPTKCHVFFDDFNDYIAGDWLVTETDAAATEALTAGNGGLLLITNTAGANDAVEVSSNKLCFTLDKAKKNWGEARVKISTHSDHYFTFGLKNVAYDRYLDAYVWANSAANQALGIANLAGMGIAGTGGALDLTSSKTLTANTFYTISWYYDGEGSRYLFVDNILVKTFAYDIDTYFPNNVAVAPFVYLSNSADAEAVTLTVDYLFAAQER